MTLVWRPGYMPLDDPDAADYIAAVEAADEAASPGVGGLEDEVRAAIHAFVKGCKADGIWPAIKASCILAGARTLAGALVPLVGTAPTNFNFVAGDYNRETGLKGDGSTKYLDTKRNNNDDPLLSNHLSVYTTDATAGGEYIGKRLSNGDSGITAAVSSSTQWGYRCRSLSTIAPGVAVAGTAGFVGIGRNGATQTTFRAKSANVISADTAAASITSYNINVFDDGGAGAFSSPRLAFYSIGESLDLALLDSRVTDLITAIGAAIP